MKLIKIIRTIIQVVLTIIATLGLFGCCSINAEHPAWLITTIICLLMFIGGTIGAMVVYDPIACFARVYAAFIVVCAASHRVIRKLHNFTKDAYIYRMQFDSYGDMFEDCTDLVIKYYDKKKRRTASKKGSR